VINVQPYKRVVHTPNGPVVEVVHGYTEQRSPASLQQFAAKQGPVHGNATQEHLSFSSHSAQVPVTTPPAARASSAPGTLTVFTLWHTRHQPGSLMTCPPAW
jgi:hypothetical protein